MEVMAFTDGPQELHIKENFLMLWNMEKVNGKNKKDKWTLISILGIIVKIRSMDMENLLGKVAMFIRGNILKSKDMDMESFFGLMGQFIKVSGNMEFNMALESYGYLMGSLKKEYFRIMFLKAQLLLMN